MLNKRNVEGFASIVLNFASTVNLQFDPEQKLLSYQWLEYIGMYANQAAANPAFAKSFLQVFFETFSVIYMIELV